ncbi:MAG: hypothetical protein PVJ44_17525 [Desulfobacterales bacterium]|jgi:ribosomal protein S18 acetylase RimI-like enzyme
MHSAPSHEQRQVCAVYIDVSPMNRSAIVPYRKSGFKMPGTRPNYYPETSEDSLVMVKLLEE